MLTLNKKTILIVVFIIVLVVLIVVNVFLFLNWQTKQKEVLRQAKVNQDIKTVQNLINQKKFTLLKPEDLQQQGLAPEAIIVADAAIKAELSKQKQIFAGSSDIPLEQDLDKLLASHSIYSSAKDTRAAQFLAMRPKIINDLGDMLSKNTIANRFKAYQVLIIIGENDLASRKQIVPYLIKGMAESSKVSAYKNAGALLSWGEKAAIPVMISGLDQQYSQLLVPIEPAVSIPQYVRILLGQYTEQSFGADQPQWQAWWVANKENINWDEDNYLYTI